MKRFRTLCILLIALFFISLGWNMADDVLTVWHSHGTWEAPFRALHDRAHMCVSVQSRTPIREINAKTGDTIYVLDNNVTLFEYSDNLLQTTGSLKALEVTLNIVMWLMVALYIWLVVMFVKLIKSFTRSLVFEQKTIHRIRLIGIGFIVMAVIDSLWSIGMSYFVDQLIDIPRLEIVYRRSIEWENLLMGLIIIVMNEILKQAMLMKEENDLTI